MRVGLRHWAARQVPIIMASRRLALRVGCALALAALGTACAGRGLTATLSPTAAPFSTQAPSATATETDEATTTPTATHTSTPSPVPPITPVPLPDFSGASVFGISLLDGRRLMVSVTVPGGIVGDYRATVRGQEFECVVLPEYPDRLYCIGPEPKGGDEALLEIFQAEADEPQFEAVFAIPQQPSGDVAGDGAGAATVQFGGGLGNNYGPSTVTINVGDTVEWQGDFSVHPLVSDNGLWGTVSSSSAFSFTFNSPGTYTYHCQVHQALGMTGEVIVLMP